MRKILSIPALTEFLRNRKGSEFVSLTYRSEPKLLKNNRETDEPNPYGRIFKVANIRGIVGFDYANSVNLQRKREGNSEVFTAQSLPWGLHVLRNDGKISPLVSNKGRIYLRVKEESVSDSIYVTEAGQEIPYAAIRGLLPLKRQNSGRQEVEKTVRIRTYAVENIRNIRIGGEEIVPADVPIFTKTGFQGWR